MLQEPQPENFNLRSLNEIDFEIGVQAPPSFRKLSREESKSLKSPSLQSTPGTATSSVASRKVSSCDQTFDTVQTAMLNLVLKKKVSIQALPEILDFNSYSITVFGNNQSLTTNEGNSKTSSEPIILKSYRTNILKIKADFFQSSHQTVYLYDSEKPAKLGEIKKGGKGSTDLNIYGPEGNLLYVLEGARHKKNKKPLLASFICGATKLESKPTVGKLVLKYVKTGESFELGSYYNNPVASNDKKKTFNSLCYDIEFPSEISNEGRTLITAALFGQIPKSIYYRSLA